MVLYILQGTFFIFYQGCQELLPTKKIGGSPRQQA